MILQASGFGNILAFYLFITFWNESSNSAIAPLLGWKEQFAGIMGFGVFIVLLFDL